MNEICPICGKTSEEVNNWSHCPRQLAPVCEAHCRLCRCLVWLGSIYRCMYANPEVLKKIEKKAI